MLSNVKLSTCLQYADHTDRATLPIGVKGRRKEEEKKKKKRRRRKEENGGSQSCRGLRPAANKTKEGFSLITQPWKAYKNEKYFDSIEE